VQTYLATLGLAVTNMSVKFEGIYKCAFVPCCPVYCYLDLHVMFLLLLERNKIKKMNEWILWDFVTLRSLMSLHATQIYTVAQKLADFCKLYNFVSIGQFSNFSHYQNQEKICNSTLTKDPIAPQVCRYTTLWNVSVLKAETENKTSVTTHFKKLTTGDNVCVVAVIV